MKKIILLSFIFIFSKSFGQIAPDTLSGTSYGCNYTIIGDTSPNFYNGKYNGYEFCKNKIEFIFSADTTLYGEWTIFLQNNDSIYAYRSGYGYLEYTYFGPQTNIYGFSAYMIPIGYGPDTTTLFNIPDYDGFKVVSDINDITTNEGWIDGYFETFSCENITSTVTGDSVVKYGSGCNSDYSFRFNYDTTSYLQNYYTQWNWWVNSSKVTTTTVDSVTFYTQIPNGNDTLHCIATSNFYNDTMTIPIYVNLCSSNGGDGNYLSLDSIKAKNNSCDSIYTFKYSIDTSASSYIKLTTTDTLWIWWSKFNTTQTYNTPFDSVSFSGLGSGNYKKGDVLYCQGLSPYPTDTLSLSFIDNLCADDTGSATGVHQITGNNFKAFIYNRTLYLNDNKDVTVEVSDVMGHYQIYDMNNRNTLSLPSGFGLVTIYRNNNFLETLKFVNIE